MSVSKSAVYEKMDRGDGVCKHFDDSLKLCTIYEKRPLLCNIDEMYNQFFCEIMSKKEYYNLNYAGCKMLKEQSKKNKA